jgi:hypothetical protein
MDQFFKLIAENETLIKTIIVFVFIAVGTTFPKTPPKTFDDWWLWFREIIQTVPPVGRALQLSGTTTVTTQTTTQTVKAHTPEQGSDQVLDATPVPVTAAKPIESQSLSAVMEQYSKK